MTDFLQDYSLAAVGLLGLTSFLLLAHLTWRWTLAALVLQYLAVAWLVNLNWPLGLAAVKLLVGWMAGAVLATSQAGQSLRNEPISGPLLRILAAGLAFVAVLTAAPAVKTWLQVDQVVVLGALVLAVSGLLQAGLSMDPLRVVIGLLSFLAGFEVLYAALEQPVLVAGLLAVVNLGLAAAGVYLLAAPGAEEEH